VFYLTAAVYTFGAIAYCILASGYVQSWAVDVTVLPAIDTVVVDMKLEGTDALLEPKKHPSSSAPASDNTEMSL